MSLRQLTRAPCAVHGPDALHRCNVCVSCEPTPDRKPYVPSVVNRPIGLFGHTAADMQRARRRASAKALVRERRKNGRWG